ncbi:MAG TPA: outer membrane beta-barrel protein [Kofleriaceae bacterium]|nr:outer membrane beta-barrel protein [Kofleriaceae bacterium]
MCRWAVTLLSLVLGVSAARADEPAPSATPAADAPPTRAELEELKEQNRELREELLLLKEDLQQTDQRVDKLAPLAAKVTGYMDFGFYYVAGNGSGIRSDFGHINYPEYSYIVPAWTFMGDPLSTAINARGEPATTGESRAITFDPIKSKGPTFIINSLNVGLFAQVAPGTLVQAKFDLVPRSLDPSNKDRLFLADFVDVRLAYLEHRITRKWMDLALFAGKFDSVIGFEYRSQEAPARVEVTPSLICRYTCGYPLGVKARALFADGLLGINVAVTNGTSFSELFPFYDEIDANQLKTGSARVHVAPFRGVELGISGLYGAQDRQANDDVRQWMYAVDFHLHRHDLVLRGEFVNGRAKGETEEGMRACNLTPCLRFKGAYGLVGYRVTNILMPYARVDWRDALHRNGVSFVYISQVGRLTAGLRLNLTQNLVLKAEYTFNRELGRTPQFPDDIFTSSLVVTY